ncbi:xylanase, partial [Gemmiger formicilis]|nr:xylanase [Gemmiger formicilis]
DPSYHLPHFYELFALWSDECDRPFWHAAAAASRQYLRKACHARTGLSAEYAEYDGRPHRGDQPDRHDWFFSDA